MIEFAIVVLLLITLLYGIITYGLILAAQATVTQAAAHAAEAGLVASSSAVSTAETQAGTDVGWMDKGTCATSNTAMGVNVLQMLTTEAELANGSSGLNVTAALNNLPVGTSAELFLKVIQPAQIAFGPVGSYTAASPCPATSGTSTCAETSQVSADLQLSVPVAGLLDIPLSAADGVATLSSITCANNAMTNTTINASTTTATAAITLANTATATLTVNGAPSTSESYDSSVVPPTASTISAGTNPRSLGVPVLSIGGLSPLSPVNGLLTSVLPGFYVPVLLAAGVSVGNADVADLGSNCDAFELAP